MRYHAPSGGIRTAFHQGLSRRAYEMLGSHSCEEGRRKWHFCVWAPNAKHVALVGSFNHYDRSAHPMKKQYDGTWELRLDEESPLARRTGGRLPHLQIRRVGGGRYLAPESRPLRLLQRA